MDWLRSLRKSPILMPACLDSSMSQLLALGHGVNELSNFNSWLLPMWLNSLSIIHKYQL
jgi:hypothetical protein